MDLLEYQAKTLFREMGIPVLPSQRIDQSQDLKGLKIPYPVVLKSQVRAGGRGKAGGIRFVENTIDAVAAAQMIFHLPIRGECPQVLLAEAKYDADRELYLAVTLDPGSRRPVLLGSQQGGVNVEATLSTIQQEIVDQDFSPFYARRLILKMGLQGDLILAVSAIVEKMYRLFVEKDLDLVEINPLGISPTGEVMALDGKVIANSGALGRHEDLILLLKAQPNYHSVSLPMIADELFHPQLNLVELNGNIGILCNGAGLTMATLDLVIQSSGKPANFLNLGGADHYEITEDFRQRLYQGIDLMTQSKSVKVVVANLWVQPTIRLPLLGEIAGYLKRKSRTSNLPQFVLRLAGIQPESCRLEFADLPVSLFDRLDLAVVAAVNLAK
ncbi:Succinyl-CoA synthetase (ADP-forming) beta subunit [Planktothrix serta PCC 8927]|uniref:Succinyl-CoA synthetase (ADP-forming) beta subunit n=1 Tax=Planktothrix serta PCC 8927 TaxID=671068 RepID=A0A7Z9BNP2_9CYAN|nr:ATP-grasp domain-containing protein [Planktothrix serta]VXD13128.1 Succinyl-CoA synthetase (ADP-forming) beta subunit [Planktothrix serta PCC 8927]